MDKFVHKPNKCWKYFSFTGTTFYAILWLLSVMLTSNNLDFHRIRLMELYIIGGQLILLPHIILGYLTIYKGYNFWLTARYYFCIILVIKTLISLIIIVFSGIQLNIIYLQPPEEGRAIGIAIFWILIIFTAFEMVLFTFSTFPLLLLYRKSRREYNQAYSQLDDQIATHEIL